MKIFGHFFSFSGNAGSGDDFLFHMVFHTSYIVIINMGTLFSLTDEGDDTPAVISGGPHTYAPPIKSSSSAGSQLDSWILMLPYNNARKFGEFKFARPLLRTKKI